MDKTHYCAQFRTKKKWHAAACAFTPPPLLWKMVGFLMVSVWNKTDIWAFISHKRTGKIRLENNNKCRNLERLKWRPFFFIPHSFGVPAAAASTKTTACTKPRIYKEGWTERAIMLCKLNKSLLESSKSVGIHRQKSLYSLKNLCI